MVRRSADVPAPARGAAAPRRANHPAARTRPAHRARANAIAPLLGAAALVIAACTNPLAPHPSDYGERLPAERFKNIERLRVEDYAQPVVPTPAELPSEVKSRFEGIENLDLSIEQARASALENNLDLKVALVDPLIAGESLRVEEARFESVFTGNIRYRNEDNPTLNTTVPNQQEVVSGNVGVSIPLRTGGRATVNLAEDYAQTPNPFVTLNTSYSSALTFSISQPLLRDAGRWVATYPIRIASYQEQVTQARTKLEVIRQLAAVDRSYWRLYAVRRALEVNQQQYELASALLERARRRVAAGDAPEVEQLRASSGVAERLEGIILAENAVLTQQRELKRIINMPGLTLDTGVMVVPASLPDPVAYSFDSRELVAAAVGNRMEMLELELQLAADAATIEFNRNQALPLVTLDYSYRLAGLGPTFRESNNTLLENNFESWFVGLAAEIPIGNEAAKARIEQSILSRLQRLSSRDARELAITEEVLNAIDAVDAGWQRILAARQAVVAAARTFEAERRQNDVGVRTATDVLDAQTRLAESQIAEIRAITDYQIALVDLAFATGTLLGAARVEWEAAPPPPPPLPPADTAPAPAQDAPPPEPAPALDATSEPR